MTPSPAPLVRLRHGTPVRARRDGLLQIGSDPLRRALVPDTSSVRGFLHLLGHGVRLDAMSALPSVAAALARAGLLVDADERNLLLEARRSTGVAVDGPEEIVSALRPTLRLLCDLAGLPESAVLPRSGRRGAGSAPEVLVRVSVGQIPEPAAPDDPTEGLPTLHVGLQDARVRVGPFMVSGRTACAGCVRAHEQGSDAWTQAPLLNSAHPSVIPSAPHRAVEDVDPLLLHTALTVAVRDLVAWAEGRQPATWSATHWFEENGPTRSQSWEPHPYCGCAWSQGVDAS